MAQLLAAGAGPADIERLHAPLGIDIGGKAPWQVAIATIAQVIALWCARRRREPPRRPPNPTETKRTRRPAYELNNAHLDRQEPGRPSSPEERDPARPDMARRTPLCLNSTIYLPATAEEAVRALAAGGAAARPLSGGTDLLVQLRAGRVKPTAIVDLKRIPGMIGIREEGGGFVIGAATSGAAMGEHAGLVKAWPGVVEAMNLIGSTQVQGRASLAGNLCNASPAADSVPAMIAAPARSAS